LTAAAALVGCSLIVPLDYTGGTEPSHDHGGQGGTAPFETGGFSGGGVGGTIGDGGMSEGGQGDATAEGGAGDVGGASGGTEPSTGGNTSAGKGGTSGGTGAMGGTAGAGGTGNVSGGGAGGSDASGGMDNGGLGGATVGGMSGQGGTSGGGLGGMGGMSGSSTAGNANCLDADLNTDPANCGSCGNACGSNQDCADGTCISSPCDGICPTWLMPDADMSSGGPKKTSLGTTADVCVEVESYDPSPGYLPAFNCWNTNLPRVMQVNGVTMTCNSANHPLNVPKRKGGYCVHATAGDYSWAGFVMPYTASDCCTAPAGTAGASH
jgi:hypothetical protein